MLPVYRRLRDSARSLPQGLKYIEKLDRAQLQPLFQLMECDDPKWFQRWALEWHSLGTTVEFVPVVISKETREVVAPFLDEQEDEK